jgi:large subunit ribosomal protein L15
MQLHDLKPAAGAHRKSRRIGRGTGSGRGKTSGRGQKGQNARSEGFRIGFEGGQMPLSQRLPKLPGFKNPFKKVYAVVNVSKLRRFPDGSKVDAAMLAEAGLVRSGLDVKVLGTGSLDRKLSVETHAISSSARKAIEARGGTVTVIGEPRKIGPRRLAAKTAKRSPKGEAEASPTAPQSGEVAPTASPRSGEVAPTAKRSGRVGVAGQPEAEQSRPAPEE